MKIVKLIVAISVLIVSCKTVKYPDLAEGLYADIQTNKGDILIKLHADIVPMTVANFVSLAEGNNPNLLDSLKGKPFYEGVKFHRVIKDFMIQAGQPKGGGRLGYSFDDEFPLNEQGQLIYKHDSEGVLSMANAGPATNSSQFFITHKATPWLDGKHSVFGKVTYGQNVVDTILQNDVINKVDIIRVGQSAKEFNAPNVFLQELENAEERKKERKRKIAVAKEKVRKEMDYYSSQVTSSGLHFLQLQKGTGEKVNPDVPTTVHYTLYDDLGNKIASSLDQNKAFTFTINDPNYPLIAGWKEGASMMYEGEKARLFIPSYLGYGEVGRLPVIKPNTDLIFEIEILKVGK
ncbi:cyclophilin family peptidyl-prolyl cis-trans isomerase [Tenacibaculum skagerrakense]|uniref:peptidylprolyl isomerase n=1 Tax=Tenacibaculum skagerrakense TaxID=186571 RepID=A0A4R2NSD8_9FLAO|nr:peptidylprolyl isomerase [Tenacibaculum skagerrakense]TCP24285.1 cyclophilin family peptidyl-prolyl cis-trans isomerase [Tenacibaculum skagerrakense]